MYVHKTLKCIILYSLRWLSCILLSQNSALYRMSYTNVDRGAWQEEVRQGCIILHTVNTTDLAALWFKMSLSICVHNTHIVRVHLSVSSRYRSAWARGVLIVKKLEKKCILKSLVSNLFLDRQHPVWYLNNLDTITSCFHEIAIQNFKTYGALICRKNRLDTKYLSHPERPELNLNQTG